MNEIQYSKYITNKAINKIFVYLTSGVLCNENNIIIKILNKHKITHEIYQQFCTSLHEAILDETNLNIKQKKAVFALSYFLRKIVVQTFYEDGYFDRNNTYRYPEGFCSDDYVLGFSRMLINKILNHDFDGDKISEQERTSMICAIFVLLFGKESLQAIEKYMQHLCLLNKENKLENNNTCPNFPFMIFCEGSYAGMLLYKSMHGELDSENSPIMQEAYEMSMLLKKGSSDVNYINSNNLSEAIHMITIRKHINQKYIQKPNE